MSASMAGPPGKPKIDAKFIADPTMWDPASPRSEKSSRDLKKARPQSAPVRKPHR